LGPGAGTGGETRKHKSRVASLERELHNNNISSHDPHSTSGRSSKRGAIGKVDNKKQLEFIRQQQAKAGHSKVVRATYWAGLVYPGQLMTV
jgi:hypothetical protein